MERSFNMLRKFLLSTAVVLLLSSGAFAHIGQVQGYSVGACNKAKIDGGWSMVSAGKHLEIGQRKKTHSACLGSAAMKQGGILDQHACVGGKGGQKLVVQHASVAGLQGQIVSGGRRGHGVRAQGQCLILNLNTKARKTGGIGHAIGSQSFVGGQSQEQTYRGGFSKSSQFVQAEQCNIIIGGKRSDVVVKNNLNVKMFQGNIAK
jgi:hypothetical protein